MKKRLNHLKAWARRAFWVLVSGLTRLAALSTVLILFFLIAYILIKGVPNLRPELFEPVYTSENQSMLPAIVNTCTMTLLSLALAVPGGIGAAVYLSEYARRGSRLIGWVRLTMETLSGIPSIVYGLFGMLLFNNALHLGYSMLSGALTLAMMILPLIMRTTEEALASVPNGYREGSYAMGAGKVRTVARVVLPAAMPGILSGIILGIGRIVGETAALMYTTGTVAKVAGLMDSGITLSVHMYRQASEGLYTEQAYATAVVLLAVVLAINGLSGAVAGKLGKGGKA